MQEARREIDAWATELERASKKGSMHLYLVVLKIIPKMRALVSRSTWVQEPFMDEDYE